MTDVMEETITEEDLAAQDTTPQAPDELVETYVRIVHNQTTGKIDNYDVTTEVQQAFADQKGYNGFLNVILKQADANSQNVYLTWAEIEAAEAEGLIAIDVIQDPQKENRLILRGETRA